MLLRIAVAVAAAAAMSAQTAPAPPTITVSAAVSLTEAMTAAARDFAQSGGGDVRFNFAASNILARQIVNGAPVDLYISADEAQMNLVDAAGLLKPGTRVDLLRNQLAVVVPDDRRRTLAGIRDLLDPSFKRIAIGDPAGVPAGVYAKQYLQQQGIWDALQPRVVPSTSVRAALVAVETGAADAAIVYHTDARISLYAAIAFVVPLASGPRIVYPAAVVRASKHPAEAQRFLDFLRGERAMRIFTGFGFAPAG